MQERRRSGWSLDAVFQEHQHEFGVRLSIAKPRDPHPGIRWIVHDVKVDVLLVEADGAIEVAHAERHVCEEGFQRNPPPTRSATASASPRRSSGSSQPAA